MMKSNCRSCGTPIEYPDEMDGKVVNCPSCQEETLLDEAPPAAGGIPDAPSKRGGPSAGLYLAMALLLCGGCLLIFIGVGGEALESQNPDGSAIREITYAVQYCSGLVVAGLALVVAAVNGSRG